MRSLRSHGAALVEYGIVVGLVSVIAVGAVNSTGEKTSNIYCLATQGLAWATGSDGNPDCASRLLSSAASVTLAEGERLVSAPILANSSFTDVTFENARTGEQIVLATIPRDVSSDFTFNTSIASLDAYNPDRTISACYQLNSSIDPICATPGKSSSLDVPLDATAFGYAVTVNDDTTMPWSNDVEIAFPSNMLLQASATETKTVRVARRDGDPITGNLATRFSSYVPFVNTDTGHTEIEFVPLPKARNVPLTLSLSKIDGQRVAYRQACYRMIAGEQMTCGKIEFNDPATIVIPVGAQEAGYLVTLGPRDVGWYWNTKIILNLAAGEDSLQSDIVEIYRPNDTPVAGGIASQFKGPPVPFEKTDHGWTDYEFITLTDVENRNVYLNFSVNTLFGTQDLYKQVCYRMVAGGAPKCGLETITPYAEIKVPVGAVEAGYRIKLPDPGVGEDYDRRIYVYLSGADGTSTKRLTNLSFRVLRPNEPE